MTQGFPPGQQVPHAYPQAGYPQQPQPQAGYPQTRAPQQAGSRGWLIVLFVAALLPTFVGMVAGFLFTVVGIDGSWFLWWNFYDWSTNVVSWLLVCVDTVFIVAAATVLFRSKVGRVLLTVSAAILLINSLAGTAVSLFGSEADWPVYEMSYLPFLVIAFLPPVNRAFRQAPATPLGYGVQQYPQQVMPQQSAPVQQAQQSMPQQGYPQAPYPQQRSQPQQWQQPPPR